jgi:transcriptional regulator with XRE-family HTH domain
MTINSSDVNLHITIGMVVKAWRESRGYSVTQLAERCGRPITKGYVSGLERDKIRQPGDDHLVLLSHALEIPVLYLVARRLPDQMPEATEGGVETSVGSLQPSPRRGFGFGAPDLSERYTGDRVDQLKEVLAEIAEVSRRIEEIRRVVEELLKSEERRR